MDVLCSDTHVCVFCVILLFVCVFVRACVCVGALIKCLRCDAGVASMAIGVELCGSEHAYPFLHHRKQTHTHTHTHAYGWCSPTCGHWHRTVAPMLCVFATEFMCDYIYVWVCVPAQKGFWTGNKCVGGCVWMCACLCCALNWMRIVWAVNLCAHMILGNIYNISRTRRGRRLSRVFLSCVYKQLDWDD